MNLATLTVVKVLFEMSFLMAAGQVSLCTPVPSANLRFVTQLSVSGCTLFVHDTGARDGPHLAVEPVMCVTSLIHGKTLKLDPVTQQLYTSIPVVLRDAEMLAVAQRQLQYLSPKSVSFANISNIRVSSDSSVNSTVQAIGFEWNASVGVLRVGSKNGTDAFPMASRVANFPSDALDQVKLIANIDSNGISREIVLCPMVQNRNFFRLGLLSSRYELPTCQKIKFAFSMNHRNRKVRVHQRLDSRGSYVIEPLLWHNITSLSDDSVKYDYSQEKYYLKLDMVLQDEATLDAVRTQLSDLSPRSVEFMRLWRADSIVSSVSNARFEIGPLMVSADWKSAQFRLYCSRLEQCHFLRSVVLRDPFELWTHVSWQLSSLVNSECILKSGLSFSAWNTEPSSQAVSCTSLKTCVVQAVSCTSLNTCTFLLNIVRSKPAMLKKLRRVQDGRWFLMIQQRISITIDFQRSANQYINGFGDDNNFWIGLSPIHSLSSDGTTLRVEMRLWNGTEWHAEYSGFRVGNARTKYRMTYGEMLRNRSNVGRDAMQHHNGMRFSARNWDNDRDRRSCSDNFGRGGWWFRSCFHFNPNGLFPTSATTNQKYMLWNSDRWVSIREVRLMLQL